MKTKPLKFANVWKIKPVKTFNFKFNLNTDRDGIKDRKDCRPFNPRKQHIDDSWRDELVDKEIRPLVNYLNSVGLKTVASCQGHPEQPGFAGRGIPYVAIKLSVDNRIRLEEWARKEGLSEAKTPIDYTGFDKPTLSIGKEYPEGYTITLTIHSDKQNITVMVFSNIYHNLKKEEWISIFRKIVKRLINSMKRYNV